MTFKKLDQAFEFHPPTVLPRRLAPLIVKFKKVVRGKVRSQVLLTSAYFVPSLKGQGYVDPEIINGYYDFSDRLITGLIMENGVVSPEATSKYVKKHYLIEGWAYV